jgi:hypothetical protein
MAMIIMNNNTNPHDINHGDNTHHQDQLINPVSLSITNTIPTMENTPNEQPLFDSDAIL